MASFALEHLTFTYPGQTRPALDDLTLTVPEGAVTVLCGESGSGKSTLLRQLKTCLTPHGTVSGTVRLGDIPLKDIPFAEQARRIGFVLQHPDDQIVTDKVFHELAFGLESLGCEETAMRLRVAEMASYFGITDWFERDVAALSGGQKQMLNLASVVVMRPDVLILDEPTSQLDPIAASTFLHTLRKLNEELGLTILLSEQRLEEAVPLADHLIVLEQGRLLAAGAPQEAAAAVRGHAIFSAMPTAARIAAALGETERLPLTVRAGRAYLGRFAPHPMPAAAPAPVDTPPVLTVRDGWFRYAQGGADVLRNFSLTLRPGELYALTGSNGSGKTTALGVLSGRLRLYRGSVYLDGKRQRALRPLRDGIGIPALPFALGMFLPLQLNLPLLIGGLIAWFVSTRSKDQALNKARMSQGTLIASGFIAGGALMGVVGAILKFADVDWKLTQWNSSNAASWVGLGMYLALIIYFAVHSLRAKKEE